MGPWDGAEHIGGVSVNTQAEKRTLVSNDILVESLVYKYLFPSIFSMLGTRMSSLINSLIIGRILGGTGLSVIALVTPISLVYMSIGSLIGVGASIVSSIALGKGEKEQCAQVYTLSYLISAGVGLLLTTAGLLNLDSIVGFLGADAAHFPYTYDYVRFYILGGMGTLFLYIPLNYLRITGKPNLAMTMLLLMSSLNVAALGIFVIVLDMGTGGTALASVTSSTLTFLFGISQLRGKNVPLRLQKPTAVIRYISSIVSAGSPSASNNVCRAIQSLGMNLLFVRMGAGMYLPCYTLVSTASDFILAIILGVSQTALPLVGISFGERDFRSIRIILKKALTLGNMIIGVLGILLFLVRNKIGLFFGIQDTFILKNAGIGFIFFAASINLSFINNVIINYFSATRRILMANGMVVSRLVLFMVAPAYLLFPAFGVYGVWISLIVAEVATFGFSFLIISLVHARNSRLSRYLLLDSALVEGNQIIDFSVQNTTEDVAFASTKITDFCEENHISPQKTMYISLTIEEMLVMINQYSLKADRIEYTDVRILITQKHIVLRIRNTGRYFNAVEYYHENKNTEEGFNRTLGIGMILKMAQEVQYQETFGMNNLIITIEKNQKKEDPLQKSNRHTKKGDNQNEQG
ncbi:MAG: ATP-binding protein [Treponema sp.]|jgi:Na+-driven multidrug efflux pump/anti-sigma regulatory factor (Ser/Thr protein kinase)|nr:ATP-binding protein [Treponema sp.]